LLAAVQVACCLAERDLGTVVVANDEIHAAACVRKTHTTSPATFHSSGAGPVGWVVEGRTNVVMRLLLNLPKLARPPRTVPRVALLKVCLGDDVRIIEQVEALGFAGWLLEAFGGGHPLARMVPALAPSETCSPVVSSSRDGSTA
jgi:L-asparaginase